MSWDALESADMSAGTTWLCAEQGFAEAVNYTEIGDSCCGLRQAKSPNAAEGQPPPQMNAAATEGEIY
ncbi:unnamed protein product [Ectocarpus sp. 4 AP-2014]